MATTARVSPPANAAGGDPISGSALALQPESLQAFNRLYATLWSRGELEHNYKEIARLRNARTTNCVFCKNVRFEQAKVAGLTEAKVDLIRDNYASSALSDKEKLVIAYTDVFLKNPAALTDELKSAMTEHFSEAQIVELTAGLAMFMGFSKIAVSLGGMPDSLPVFTMPTPV
ncbi:carboxymuconolactone decarboxylase family protein [Oceanicoccus sp. KOV_DT_Chl]|uniref:carboxymuconolactone decarboxylase family protein n=1 Tax=Oceanicoccus sp. KOV_DT_Chl TaxID=1904639 RepID=UPI000C7C95F3|nr:carboxymuconolactone decarboxylase family protein [Oceanicoccus sp. KOV_DT_Chl]